jgi:hypothetical protein
MKPALVILAAVLMLAGCAGKPVSSTTVQTQATPAAHTKTFVCKQPYFTVRYDDAVMTPRMRRFSGMGNRLAWVSFYDTDSRDRPGGLAGRRGGLLVQAIDPVDPGSGTWPWAPGHARGWLASIQGVLRERVKGPVAASVSPAVFEGMHGWRVFFGWKRGTETDLYLSRGQAGYVLSIYLARSLPPQRRQAFYCALQSFRATR